jgi:hypothetical protein
MHSVITELVFSINTNKNSNNGYYFNYSNFKSLKIGSESDPSAFQMWKKSFCFQSQENYQKYKIHYTNNWGEGREKWPVSACENWQP